MASRVSIDFSYFDSLIFETRLACCASEHVSKKRQIEKETNNIIGMKIEFDKNKAIPWWRVMKIEGMMSEKKKLLEWRFCLKRIQSLGGIIFNGFHGENCIS